MAEASRNLYERGLQLAEAGRKEEALACIQEYLQDAPDDGEALNDAGAIHYCLGRVEEALKNLEKAKELRGGSPEVLWNLVEAYLAGGRPSQAVQLFDDMQRAETLNPDVLNRTATAFIDNGQKGHAIEMLLWSQKLAPNQEILGPMIEVIRSKRPKIAFFCGGRHDTKFLGDIYEFAKERFPVRVFNGSSTDEMAELMKWSNISWFEWCTEYVIEASKLSKLCKNIVRLHRWEAYADMPAKVNWNNIDVLITVGNDFVKDALRKRVSDIEFRTRLVTIPNGVNLERFKFVERQRGRNIACVGHLNLRKNPMFLLQCMQKLHYIDGGYRLFFAGDFQDEALEQYARHMVKAMDLEGVVVFDGWQEDINAWLADKHYIISASIGESQGMGLLEGMATGLKPVVHNFPGAAEIFSSEFLFNISEQFCEQILSSNYDPPKYRAFVEERYPLKHMLDSINNILLEFEQQVEQLPRMGASPDDAIPVRQISEPGAEVAVKNTDFGGIFSHDIAPRPGDFNDNHSFARVGANPANSLKESPPDTIRFSFEGGNANDVFNPADWPTNRSQAPATRVKTFSSQTSPSMGTPVPLARPQRLGEPGPAVGFGPHAAKPPQSFSGFGGATGLGTLQKVLVEFNAIVGEVLCMEPSIRALKRQLGPNAEIHLRVKHPEIYDNHPDVTSVEDVLLPHRVRDYDKEYGVSWQITKENRYWHLIDRIASQLGVALENRLPRMYLDGRDFAQLMRFDIPQTSGPRIAIGTGCRWPSKRWDDDKWLKLSTMLRERFNAMVIELGSDKERAVGCGFDLVGRTTVREAAAILSRCNLLISIDSCVHHIAAAVGIPRVVLFGPVSPQTSLDPGVAQPVISSGPCRGCLNTGQWDEVPPRICPKNNNECMSLITVEQVFAAVAELLARR